VIFTEKKSYRFEPDFELDGVKNLDLPKSQRVSALITRPDVETMSELTELEVARTFSKKQVEKAADGKSEEEKRKSKLNFLRRQDTGRILREHVSDIRNVEVDEVQLDGKSIRKKITSGAELAESMAFGIDVLVQKFCAEVLKAKLGEEEEKNSEPPSSST